MANRKSVVRARRQTPALGDQTIPVSRLHLDTRNPRHEPLEGDAAVISQLCNEELVAELAQDIAARGTLNPLDILGVIPFDGNPGHFIAVEGNRRTCALILLADPSRAPSSTLRDKFKDLAVRTSFPREVRVHVFASRLAAKPWIDLRHLGPQGGIGTREWNASQKTRASGGNAKTSSRANTLSLAVLDRLLEQGLLTQEQREQVSLTTLTRYLGTPGVRAILGLASNTDLVYTHEASEVDAALYQLVIDSIAPLIDGSFSVNSRSSSADRLSYATSLKAKGLAPETPLPSPATPTRSDSSASDKSQNQKKQRSARNPAKLQTLFDRSFTVPCKDSVLLRLREEALELSLENFPFSGNYLLRAFVEQTMVLFAKKRGKFAPRLTDEQLTQICADELKAMNVTGKALSVINKAAGSAAQPHSLHSLGHAVHGASIPTRQTLRAVFDTWEPSLREMLDALK